MDMLQGKTSLVTGGSNGIGKCTAEGLARMGATVVIVGRDAQKTACAAEEIRSASGNPAVHFLIADLSSQQEIQRLAAAFRSEYQQLHILINNAGAIFSKRERTVDGLEKTFALNHLGYFLLTNLLLDVLQASAPARIINVSSLAHRIGTIAFDNLQGERSYGRMRAYSNSKLANVLFTVELARRLQGTGVTANALHPGYINSGFGKNNPVDGLSSFLVGVFTNLFARSPEEGARTSIYLASSPAVEGITGKYFSNSKISATMGQATDRALAKRLWEVSAELVHLPA
jgi:NAD(P)-dependent dehydrogenase (short-subunit alcohol dehydrogenase family)